MECVPCAHPFGMYIVRMQATSTTTRTSTRVINLLKIRPRRRLPGTQCGMQMYSMRTCESLRMRAMEHAFLMHLVPPGPQTCTALRERERARAYSLIPTPPSLESRMWLSSRTALQRYTHHYERFANHAKSRELESKLREATLEKMETMQDEGNKTWLDVQFMKQATAQLIEARQILQVPQCRFSSPHAFSSTPRMSSELEQSTEHLRLRGRTGTHCMRKRQVSTDTDKSQQTTTSLSAHLLLVWGVCDVLCFVFSLVLLPAVDLRGWILRADMVTDQHLHHESVGA